MAFTSPSVASCQSCKHSACLVITVVIKGRRIVVYRLYVEPHTEAHTCIVSYTILSIHTNLLVCLFHSLVTMCSRWSPNWCLQHFLLICSLCFVALTSHTNARICTLFDQYLLEVVHVYFTITSTRWNKCGANLFSWKLYMSTVNTHCCSARQRYVYADVYAWSMRAAVHNRHKAGVQLYKHECEQGLELRDQQSVFRLKTWNVSQIWLSWLMDMWMMHFRIFFSCFWS